jgi:hypothetical protein
MSDLTLLIGDNEVPLKAHKLFLMTASPIFHEVLSKTSDDEVVNIKLSFKYETMQEICRFAYNDSINLTSDNMLDILDAATKLEMRYLVEKIVGYICKEMNVKTVFKILAVNEKYRNLRINMKCIEFIEKNFAKCIQDPEFKTISHENLRMLLTNCKIPANLAKNSVELWSHENHFEDLSELLSFVKLKDENSDDESVASVSSAKSKHDFNENNRGRSQTNRRMPRKSNKDERLSIAKNGKNDNGSIDDFILQTAQEFRNDNNNHRFIKNLVINGEITRKNFKYANLDLQVLDHCICITELTFIYDLLITDTAFSLSINVLDSNGTRRRIFNCNEAINEPMTSFKLNQPVKIFAHQKVWIRIEFEKQEFRKSFNDYSASTLSDPFVALRRDTSMNSYAQIVKNVQYALA